MNARFGSAPSRMVLALCLVATGACGDSAPRALAGDDAAVQWAPLHWSNESSSGHVQHSALEIPVTLDGATGEYLLQLDTGAGWPILYDRPYRQLLRRARRPDTPGEEVTIGGRVGAYTFRAETIQVARDFGDTLTAHDSAAVIGTLGLHFLRRRLLVLDYPRQRFAIIDSQVGLPHSLRERAQWIPIRYEHGYIYVPLAIDGTVRDDIIYDTGASMFPVMVDLSMWTSLTGRAPTDSANVVTRGMTWGKQMLFVGAPARMDIRLGDVAAGGRPMVYFSTPDTVAGNHVSPPSFPFKGLVGNALLGDSIILIVDLPHRRLGIVRGT